MSKKEKGSPAYLQVAIDIAGQIAEGELREGQRFSGRSLMSSKYGVSPETIRRALGLLNEMDIVSIEPSSGVVVKSRARAALYAQRRGEAADMRRLQEELDTLTAQRRALDLRIESAIARLTDTAERFRRGDSLQTYEFTLSPGTRIEGLSISQSAFRRETGATILGIRRGEDIILSPSPETLLQEGDVLIVVCDMLVVPAVSEFVSRTK